MWNFVRKKQNKQNGAHDDDDDDDDDPSIHISDSIGSGACLWHLYCHHHHRHRQHRPPSKRNIQGWKIEKSQLNIISILLSFPPSFQHLSCVYSFAKIPKLHQPFQSKLGLFLHFLCR